MFTIGAFGIILDDKDRVLLCHRRDVDLWNLPGGKVEDGESPWDALIREIREETGLGSEIIKLTGVYNKPQKNEIVFSFACKIVSGIITLTDEADRIEYFSLDQIPQNTSPKQIERIKDYFTDQSKTHYKIQTGLSSIDLINSARL